MLPEKIAALAREPRLVVRREGSAYALYLGRLRLAGARSAKGAWTRALICLETNKRLSSSN